MLACFGSKTGVTWIPVCVYNIYIYILYVLGLLEQIIMDSDGSQTVPWYMVQCHLHKVERIRTKQI